MEVEKQILIVDDNKEICDVFKEWMEDEDFSADVSYSGNSAIKLLKKINYKVLITDVKMQDGSGIDILKYLQTVEEKPDLIIIMTGYSDFNEEEFKKMGATHFFKKPVDLETVTSMIETQLSK